MSCQYRCSSCAYWRSSPWSPTSPMPPSFNSGRFPAKLKLGQITPLLKKAGLDAPDDCNFRPISNLPTMSKLLERLALSRLQPHLLSFPNYSTLQFSLHTGPYIPLRPLCSKRSLMISTDRWTMVPLLPWSAYTFLLLTIPLITVFYLSGRLQSDVSIDGKALAWIQSHLCDRHSFVQVGRSAACQQPCIAHVPQGSVLGPLLFAASRRAVALSADSVSITTHTLISFHQPVYFAHLIRPYSQSRSLRSSTQSFLSVPSTTSTLYSSLFTNEW